MYIACQPGKERKSMSGQQRLQQEIKEVGIAIVGGGIAGLYCGLDLKERLDENEAFRNNPDFKSSGKPIAIFEASSRLGGRIYTQRLDRAVTTNVSKVPDASAKEPAFKNLEFYAEFGPMRIEREQILLHKLLGRLEIPPKIDAKADTAHLVDFPAYASPVSEHEPKYELVGAENDQNTPLDLMLLAFARILVRLKVSGIPESQRAEQQKAYLRNCIEEGVDSLILASSPVLVPPLFWRTTLLSWIKRREEPDYQNIREYALLDGVPLWKIGFWNLLSDVLSHDAVMKLRDLGTFYHLIPDNPNAAEWLIFWLRNLKASEHLQGIHGGMQCITEEIERRLESSRVTIELDHQLVEIEPDESLRGCVLLTFNNAQQNTQQKYRARHVILALPKAPIEKLATTNKKHFPPEIIEHLDAVFGFPMVKIFITVKKRWWEEEYRANRYATRIPTRELHYWKSQSSTKGMIMIYTDRPASSFWANYVTKPGRQDEPECNDERRWTKGEPKNQRLIVKILQYANENGANILEDDIEWYGIRDWGREPYLGANHTWRPERQSWVVLKALSNFHLTSSAHKCDEGCLEPKNVHICGEAYSDYHGFIEGSLRSSAHVLHTMYQGHFKTETPWLCKCENCLNSTIRCGTKEAVGAGDNPL
jgi:Flavin containing amine oxidoreductase